MKYLAVLLLLAPVVAESIRLSPTYVRMPVNSSQTITITLTGSGKAYDLKLYGPYLEWQSRRVWVGPSGKTLAVRFSPEAPGRYEVNAEFGRARSGMVAEVYVPDSMEGLYARIQELRREADSPEALAIIEEAERLYNQSRFQMAELKLRELEGIRTARKPPSDLPKVVLVAVLALLSIASLKLLLT